MDFFNFFMRKKPTEEERAAEVSRAWIFHNRKTKTMEMKLKEREAKKSMKDQVAKGGVKKTEKWKRGKAHWEGPSTSYKQGAGAAGEYAFKPNEGEKSADGDDSDITEDLDEDVQEEKTEEKLNLSVYDFTDDEDYEADEETEETRKMT